MTAERPGSDETANKNVLLSVPARTWISSAPDHLMWQGARHGVPATRMLVLVAYALTRSSTSSPSNGADATTRRERARNHGAQLGGLDGLADVALELFRQHLAAS
jgi:hypothetical protein